MSLPAGNSLPLPEPDPSRRIDWLEVSAFAHEQAGRILGGHARRLAEDVAQESLRKFYPIAFSAEDWRALLFTVLQNTARTAIRREKARRQHECRGSGSTEAVPGSAHNPLENLLTRDQIATLRACLAQLDEKFGRGTRAILEWRHLTPPITWIEIAAIVELSERGCRDRYAKAANWLYRRLST